MVMQFESGLLLPLHTGLIVELDVLIEVREENGEAERCDERSTGQGDVLSENDQST